MTLQYRIRSRYEDEQWTERVRLCEKFLSQVIELWCRGDGDFPTREVVAGILFLFSPRCEPFGGPEQHLHGLTSSPEEIYAATWPMRAAARATTLVESLSAILAGAATAWAGGSILVPSSEAVVQHLVEQIVAQQFVIFHHCESSRRDINPFGI